MFAASDTIVLPIGRKELGTGAAQRRDWRGIGTALLVIFVICMLIFLCGYIFTPLGSKDAGIQKHQMNLTDLKRFRPANSALSFLGDGQRLMFENEEGVHIIGFSNLNTSLLISHKEIHDLLVGGWTDLSDFLSLLLNPQQMEQMLQRGAAVQCNFDCSQVSLSYAADNPIVNPENETNNVYVVDVETKSLHRVTRMAGQPEPIKYHMWSPNGNDFLFAQGGQLYYVVKVGEAPVAISNKEEGKKVHGVFDWMTYEEIFSSIQAAWWAKNGAKIAFASRELVDEPAITLTAYRNKEKYQLDSRLIYPKTGDKRLPIYTLSVWDKATGTLKQMDVQLRDSLAFHYLFSAKWVTLGQKEVLAAVWANRWQNHTSLTYCDFETAVCSLVSENSYPSKMWALPEEYKNLVGTKDSVFLILPRQMPNGIQYQHVAKVNIKGGSKQFLSLGTFDVKSIVFYDEANDLLYFNAWAPLPTNHHLYVTKATPSSRDVYRDYFNCVTCGIQNCSYVTSTISADGRRLSMMCRGPGVPRFYVGELDNDGKLDDNTLKNVREVLHDHRLEQLVENTNLPEVITEDIPLGNGFAATTRLYKPRSKQLSSLPLLVYVYGGPGYQVVDDTFGVTWTDYLVTNLNIAVLRIDARGTGARGWKYRSPVYGAMGTVEMEDQIEATQLILKKYPYLDASRVAIHGWSYGGFATLRIVQTAPTHMFKCAIAGAPVTNFQYYDAAYTERYMGAAPREAYVDLNEGDMSKFKSTRLLLIHGLADDNVHFQNSAVFSEALQTHQVDFDFMVYSNERHHLTGEKWTHGYTRMTSFLRECLSK